MPLDDIDAFMNGQMGDEPADEPDAQEPIEDASTDDAGADTGEEQAAAEELILGKYRTPEDAFNAHKELQSYSTRRDQELAEMRRKLEELQAPVEEEEWVDEQPSFALPFGQDPQTQEQFDAWLIDDPQSAFGWAAQSGNAKLAQYAEETWKSVDPATYAVALANAQHQPQIMALQQQIAEMRDEQARALAPHQQVMEKAQVDTFVTLAQQKIGDDFTTYRERIGQSISSNPMFQAAWEKAKATGPAAQAELVAAVYRNLKWDEYQQQAAAPVAEAPRGATRTRQSAVTTPDTAATEAAEIARGARLS